MAGLRLGCRVRIHRAIYASEHRTRNSKDRACRQETDHPGGYKHVPGSKTASSSADRYFGLLHNWTRRSPERSTSARSRLTASLWDQLAANRERDLLRDFGTHIPWSEYSFGTVIMINCKFLKKIDYLFVIIISRILKIYIYPCSCNELRQL